jgi:hypothetical protein
MKPIVSCIALDVKDNLSWKRRFCIGFNESDWGTLTGISSTIDLDPIWGLQINIMKPLNHAGALILLVESRCHLTSLKSSHTMC